MNRDNYEPPKPDKWDNAHLLARAGIASIPLVGGAGLEFFNRVVAQPLERRRNAWMDTVAAGMRQLEESQKCVIDDLPNNPAFIDTVMQATRAAVVTSQQEKWEALRNAVLNSAMPSAPEATIQAMFLNIIDSLTGLHIRVLDYIVNFQQWHETRNKAPRYYSPLVPLWSIVADEFPELKDNETTALYILNDLQQRGLLEHPPQHDMDITSLREGLPGRPHKLAKEFLAFIREPKPAA